MAAASDRVVTVFGGTGFVGRRIVRHLRLHGFHVRVASRRPDPGHAQRRPDDPQLRSINADVHDARSVADALADAYGVVNAVSLYVEQGRETFHSVHVEAAQRVAAQAQRAGVKRLVHVSGIGADPRSQSVYIRMRGEGELAVREAFADAVLIRPAVMFGPDDAFLTTILKLLERLPIYPMFGNGQMRLQPVHVEDVGQAIAKILQREQTGPIMFECGGPRVYSYEEFLRTVASAAGIKPLLIPVPFAGWDALAWIAEMLPSPPITRNQVELMQIDSTPRPDTPGLGELGISPHSIEEMLQDIVRRH
ncbi:MAG TPA: complex I NDUFA9 subunit family protein [Roseiarcus sp.]|nr:complex I NDUFA9 subunit family protein [Roseiarcus sp.]